RSVARARKYSVPHRVQLPLIRSHIRRGARRGFLYHPCNRLSPTVWDRCAIRHCSPPAVRSVRPANPVDTLRRDDGVFPVLRLLSSLSSPSPRDIRCKRGSAPEPVQSLPPSAEAPWPPPA